MSGTTLSSLSSSTRPAQGRVWILGGLLVALIVAAPLVGNAEAVAGAVVGGNATSGTEGLAL